MLVSDEHWTRGSPCFNWQRILIRTAMGGLENGVADGCEVGRQGGSPVGARQRARRAGRGRDQGVGGDRGLKILEPGLAVGTGGVRRQRACAVDPNRCGLPLSGNPCGGIGQSREGLKFEACRESHVAVMLPMQMSRVSFSVCPCPSYFAVPAVVWLFLSLSFPYLDEETGSSRFGGYGPPCSRDGGKMVGSKRRQIGCSTRVPRGISPRDVDIPSSP
ncbi:hypothetical protein GQ607_006662 [Colletotrichum asianum]|uniref:Uncharacterized protein n=1 Tax=Colletotrichum asianum TaxID=702518 RepID=A0A8H3ZN67_9PEZI|nr:hypothetical protein GQ607_006662 [Colletotrichum asianum]